MLSGDVLANSVSGMFADNLFSLMEFLVFPSF
jgi:hypothetical protein